jgi:hypothetical protein
VYDDIRLVTFITIPKGASFKDMVALKGKPDIGDQINKKIIAPLANARRLPELPRGQKKFSRPVESYRPYGRTSAAWMTDKPGQSGMAR